MADNMFTSILFAVLQVHKHQILFFPYFLKHPLAITSLDGFCEFHFSERKEGTFDVRFSFLCYGFRSNSFDRRFDMTNLIVVTTATKCACPNALLFVSVAFRSSIDLRVGELNARQKEKTIEIGQCTQCQFESSRKTFTK